MAQFNITLDQEEIQLLLSFRTNDAARSPALTQSRTCSPPRTLQCAASLVLS